MTKKLHVANLYNKTLYPWFEKHYKICWLKCRHFSMYITLSVIFLFSGWNITKCKQSNNTKFQFWIAKLSNITKYQLTNIIGWKTVKHYKVSTDKHYMVENCQTLQSLNWQTLCGGKLSNITKCKVCVVRGIFSMSSNAS